MADLHLGARLAVERCRKLATYTEEPGVTTRTYLSAPMHEVHRDLRAWMEACGCHVSIDAAGNLRGLYGDGAAPRFLLVSHLDTVPHAGAFDGILGVMLGLGLVESLQQRKLPVAIEIIGFSEEEGVRYGIPFLGSRAVIGELDGATAELMTPAIREFGLDITRMPEARLAPNVFGSLEFHIEQGPVLEQMDLRLGIVESIAGQSRVEFRFEGAAAHAGTTPASFRRDALAAAAKWIVAVEERMKSTHGLMATVGKISVEPGATNVIAGAATAVLDVRHASDGTRLAALRHLLHDAQRIGAEQNIRVSATPESEQAATPMDAALTARLEGAVVAAGYRPYRMASGAGHDSMILARHVPATMLFLRSPGGISHSPAEDVRAEDVEAALACGVKLLDSIAEERARA